MILITGASGNAGGTVLQAALNLQLPVRAMYRRKDEARNAPQGVTSVVGDFSDKASLVKALENIESVYLVCAPIPQLVELEGNMIDACVTAGVKYLVLNSALGAGQYNKSFPSWHTQVEEKLKSSGLDYTILRPNGFMQNIVTYNAASIKSDHAFYAAIGDAKTSLIDVRDIGEIAAKILSAPEQHKGKIYELNGPEALTNADIAACITRITGNKITYVDIPEDAQRHAMLGMGMPSWQVTAILDLQDYYRRGKCAIVDDTVSRLLDKPARLLEAYLQENKAALMTKAA